MPDDKGEIRELPMRQGMLWTRLFEAFWIALLDPAKLLLAAMAILVMYVGLAIFSWLFSGAGPKPPNAADYTVEKYLDDTKDQVKARERADRAFEEAKRKYQSTPEMVRWKATSHFRGWPANQDRGQNPYILVRESARNLASYEYWHSQFPVLLEPLDKFLYPVFLLFNENADFLTKVFAVLCLLWIFLTWAIFGGALTRMIAVQFARREKVGPIEALTFAFSKWLSYFLAPLFPLVVVLLIGLVMLVVGGVLLNLYLDFLAGILWFLALIGGIVMVLTLIGYAGWPLMYATISAEGSDTFDAVFRSYSYIYQRPWQYVFYTAVSLAYGAIVIFFVVFATSFMVYMARWGVELAEPLIYRDNSVESLFVYAPQSYEWQKLLLSPNDPEHILANMNIYQKISAGFTAIWLHLIFLFMIGFAYSYFWTTSTIIYFLLRKSVDGNDLDEVYLIQDEEPLPVMPPATMKSAEPAVAAGSTSLPLVEPMAASVAAGSQATAGSGSTEHKSALDRGAGNEQPPGG
jgi:hypothetical protein